MNDPFEHLQQQLVNAARRRDQTSRWRHSRALALGLATLTVAGTATAAVITRSAGPSAPLAGPLPASQTARAYSISLSPDLRAGQVGWCTSTAFTSGGKPSVTGFGCGPAATKGSPVVAAGTATGQNGGLEYAVVTSRVAVVTLPGGTRVVPRTDPTLPNGWKAAISLTPAARPDPGRYAPPSYEDANGKPIPSPRDSFAVRFPSHPPAGARREGCEIGDAAGYRSLQPRVASPKPQPSPLENPAFASCARTIFQRLSQQGSRRRTTLIAAILLNAQDPGERATAPPPSEEITYRRLGPGWLAVSGGTQSTRARLLSELRAHV